MLQFAAFREGPDANPSRVWLFFHALCPVQKGPKRGRALKDPSQARLCYCFDLKFAIRLLVERDKTSTVQLVKI